MKNPSCLIMMFGFPLFLAVISFLLWRLRLPVASGVDPLEVLGQSVGVGSACGFLAMLALLWLNQARRKLHDKDVLRRSAVGDLRDGGRVVVGGRLTPLESTLKAPISGDECLLYRWAFSSRATTGKMRSTRFHAQGFGMAPCLIQGQGASLRFFTFPKLEVPTHRHRDAEAYRRAQDYAADSDFETRPTVIVEHDREIWTKLVENTLSINHCVADWDRKLSFEVTEADTSRKYFLEEWLVRPGEEVWIAGTYSAQLGGVAPPETTIRSDKWVRLTTTKISAVSDLNRRAVYFVLASLGAATTAVMLGRGFLSGAVQKFFGW